LILRTQPLRLQFGNFVVDDGTRQLLRDGVAVHLSPKAFELLLALIIERPRALTKADLHKRLWPTTFVSDASLAMLIAEIRAALGESARQPRCVRTVHRHGYAFQVAADALSESAPPSGAPAYWLVTASRQIPLEPGDNIVGRDPKARVWLDSPSVSRRHAVIRVKDDGAILEDLGSKNGTHAGDRRVTGGVCLADGDQLRFGTVDVSVKAWTADPTHTESDPL
jgi:DNA-binding winged helix-turn-helix (wHTH) protein